MPGVVIPFAAADDEHARIEALAWVKKQYRIKLPDYHVVIERGDPFRPFCKGELVNRGVEKMRASDDPVIVADADVWTDGLPAAVRAVTCGVASWAIPHLEVFRLTKKATWALYNNKPMPVPPSSRPYDGVKGGGFVIAQRETLMAVPLDERFTGWGQEDQSWGLALATMEGEPWRGTADLYHMWHPSPERHDRRMGSHESWALYKRYSKANGYPDRMEELLAACR